jgi:hypothetical protein
MTTDQRLERLERQNRWMTAAVASMAVVLAVVFLVAAGQDQEKDKPKVLEEVRAKRVAIVDNAGNDRIILDAPEGRARLAMFTGASEDKPQLALGVESGGVSVVALFDERGALRADLTLQPSGVVGYHVYDVDGAHRIHLGLDYGAELRFADKKDTNRVMIGLTPTDTSHVSVQGGKPGGDIATIGATATSALRIGFVETEKPMRIRTGFFKDPGKDPRFSVTGMDGTVLFEVPDKK